MRLFLSFNVSGEIKKSIQSLLPSWRKSTAGVSWVPPENLHITIKFLGEYQESKIEDLSAVLEQMCGEAEKLTLSPEGGGCFPNPSKARVVIIAFSSPQWLSGWVRNLERELKPLGIKQERRQFKAHATVARIRNPLPFQKVDQILGDISHLLLPDLYIDRLSLMESRLTSHGAIYKTLRTFELGGDHA